MKVDLKLDKNKPWEGQYVDVEGVKVQVMKVDWVADKPILEFKVVPK